VHYTTDSSALENSISALESAISALESDVKTLESSSVLWEHSVWVFTFLVAVGVAMELWVIRHEYRDDMEAWALSYFGVLRSPGRPSISKLGVEVGSVLLITIGIIGELGVGIKVASINGALRGKSAELRSKNADLRSKSDQLLALVTQQAGDAAASAKQAHNEADTVKAEADALKLRLGNAAKELADLEQEILLQGPRWGLLKRGEETFVEVLKPFKGQKITVVVCGQGETERFVFEQVLLDLLRKAGWSTDYTSWNDCPTMLSGGNEVFFVSEADTVTQWVMPYPCSAPCPAPNEDTVARAGRAFCDLMKKLGIGTTGWMEAPPRFAGDEQAFSRARQFFGNGTSGSPAELALRAPSTVFVLVGPHPPEFGMPQSKKIKTNHTK
jgi:hypothetical protein